MHSQGRQITFLNALLPKDGDKGGRSAQAGILITDGGYKEMATATFRANGETLTITNNTKWTARVTVWVPGPDKKYYVPPDTLRFYDYSIAEGADITVNVLVLNHNAQQTGGIA